MRNALLALMVVGLGWTTQAQGGWAAKMFTEGRTHDFGSVPRGAQLVHRFKLTNIYAVPMEITAIKSGCGCVSASAAQRELAPRGSTTVDVRVDTRSFTGPKSVRVRVSVGPKFISTTELTISVQSRPDVVFNPGEVNFGTVNQGQKVTRTLDVEYAGVLAWKVSQVINKGAPVTVALKEMYRRPGQVGYQLQVALKPDAPAGSLKHDLFLKTNDPASPLVPVHIEGYVQSALTVSPSTLRLGNVPVGGNLKRRIILRASRPFLVKGVEGIGEGIELGVPPSTVAIPVQTLTFQCKLTRPGPFRRVLKINTDLQQSPVAVTIEGTGIKE